tara:strand:- start:122 stop:1918 length:1797 start_codon:yes stop_codon:yes gene_type:complete
MINEENIRNISIIAHVDHGKSTLADRFLEIAGLVTPGEHVSQILDSMDLERERGITIKSQPVSLEYQHVDTSYRVNIIDTPGHVDFSYEVSRALMACEGAILLVDGTQGVQAQTLAHSYEAIDLGLHIIPVINKIDSGNVDIDSVSEQIYDLIGSRKEEISLISAKTGDGVEELFQRIINEISPNKSQNKFLKALIFDSYFDSYKGVVASVRIFNGSIQANKEYMLVNNNNPIYPTEVGIFDLGMKPISSLGPGEVGYIVTGSKDLTEFSVGETIVERSAKEKSIIEGFKSINPNVYSSIFPSDSDEYVKLRDALDKYSLNDSSFFFEPESSSAFGFGFRCGFLGLLHMEIVVERLEREYDLSLIVTPPTVEILLIRNSGEEILIKNPSEMSKYTDIKEINERIAEVVVISPKKYLGNILKLLTESRGEQKDLSFLSSERVKLIYSVPLLELVSGFYDTLKSISQGFATFDYKIVSFKKGDLVKVDLLVNGQEVDSFSSIVAKEKADFFGRSRVEKLSKLIPRQQFDIPIQAAIGSRIIARETVKALRKDVTAKLYGGDVSRKKKLLESQKKGKKKMKKIGNVNIPKEVFQNFLKQDL